MDWDYWCDREYEGMPITIVAKKYDTFKQEILNYGNGFSIYYYYNQVLPKIEALLNTNAARSLMARHLSPRNYTTKCPIGFNNLVSLVLYTDYDRLSTSFSASFRKTGPLETLEGHKERHRKYWWWAKTLKETIAEFGDTLGEDRKGKLHGPFHTGMSTVTKLSHFHVLLASPTSTSVHLEVAALFSDDDGMIITFENVIDNAVYTRGFDVSWLSRYKEEDERYADKLVPSHLNHSRHQMVFCACRLFCGCSRHVESFLDIATIRIIETRDRFEIPVKGLNHLNRILKGNPEIEFHRAEDAVEYLPFLHKIFSNNTDGMSTYIKSTLNCFVDNTSTISIHLPHMQHVDIMMLDVTGEMISDCMMNSLDEGYVMRDDEDETNLFKPSFLQIFKEVTEVTIHTQDYDKNWHIFTISLFYLLKLVIDTAVEDVRVEAAGQETWLWDLWSSTSERICDAYDKHSFAAWFDRTESEEIICVSKK